MSRSMTIGTIALTIEMTFTSALMPSSARIVKRAAAITAATMSPIVAQKPRSARKAARMRAAASLPARFFEPTTY